MGDAVTPRMERLLDELEEATTLVEIDKIEAKIRVLKIAEKQ